MSRSQELIRAARAQLPTLLRTAAARALRRPGSSLPLVTATGVLEAVEVEPELAVTVVDSASELEKHVMAWRELAAAALEPNAFYEPFALLPALRELQSAGRVRVVLVDAPHPSRRKGERILCGLFPLEVRAASGPLPVQMLGMWKHPYCYSCAPLVRADLAGETLRAFFDWLAGSGSPLLRVEEFPGEGALRHLVITELNRRRWTSFVGAAYTRAVFRPGANTEAFLSSLPGKKRKEWRRQRQRLAEEGRLEVRALAASEDCGPWLDRFIELEARSWKGREGVSLRSRAPDERFFRALSQAAHADGRLMMLALDLDGRPIAMKHNLFTASGEGVAFKITFDEVWARFSPGVLLELENIARLHERGVPRPMDSCAAETRFMINQLWKDRRELQTLFIAPGAQGALAISLLPLMRFFRDLSRDTFERFTAP